MTSIGIILYGILRMAYSSFYQQFGLKPEDVGLGYSETLAQSAPGLVVLLVLSYTLISAYAALARVYIYLGKKSVALVKDPISRLILLSTVVSLVGLVILSEKFPKATFRIFGILAILVLLLKIISWMIERMARAA